MSVSPEQLPCSPLDVSPVAQPVPYLEYWRQYQAAYPSHKDAESLRRLAVAGSVLVRNPEKFTGIPHLTPDVNSSSPTEEIIEVWDRGLGSFNPLSDAGGDLLRGAATILQGNHVGPSGNFPVVRTSAPRDVVEAFLDLSDQIDMGRQKPSHALLVGAQLVHKAALIETDVTRQENLLGMAQKLYGRIDDPGVQWGPDRFRAAQYSQDVQFHLLDRAIGQSLREGHYPWRQRDKAVILLRKGLNDLFRMYDFITSSDNRDRKRQLSGEMAEPFVNNIIRDKVYVRSALSAFSEDHFTVRSAFTSEDEPLQPQQRKIDGSYDCVLNTKGADGRVRESVPLQIKIGNGAEAHGRAYHPCIKVISLKGLGCDKMVRVGRSLLRAYDNYQWDRIVEGLDMVLGPLEPYLSTTS